MSYSSTAAYIAAEFLASSFCIPHDFVADAIDTPQISNRGFKPGSERDLLYIVHVSLKLLAPCI